MFKNAYWLAVILIIALLFWLSTGSVNQALDTAPTPLQNENEQAVTRVSYRALDAQTIEQTLTMQGWVEAQRAITLISRLNSTIKKLAVTEGQSVTEDSLLIALDSEDMPSRLEAIDAQIEKNDSQLTASKALSGRGLASEAELNARKADLADAMAQKASLELQLGFTELRAPFSGVIDRVLVENGEHVRQGQALLELVDNSRLLMVGRIPQQQVHSVAAGQVVRAQFLDGRHLTGRVRFIASRAHPDTRAYRFEAVFDNPDRLRLAGSTATLSVVLGEVSAHALSPAMLTLNAQGELAVQHIDDEARIVETAVKRVRANAKEIWVSGLPEQIRLLTLGKGFVQVGDRVDPQSESTHE